MDETADYLPGSASSNALFCATKTLKPSYLIYYNIKQKKPANPHIWEAETGESFPIFKKKQKSL